MKKFTIRFDLEDGTNENIVALVFHVTVAHLGRLHSLERRREARKFPRASLLFHFDCPPEREDDWSKDVDNIPFEGDWYWKGGHVNSLHEAEWNV